ncbi:Protein IQ-DOMAIN 19 [Linum perenne]
MGKAGKWVINFLLGKKEGKKVKRTDQNGMSEDMNTEASKAAGVVVPPPSPSNHKRRWSFGNKSSKGDTSQSHSFNPLYHNPSSDAIAQLIKASSVGRSSDAVAFALREAAAGVVRFSRPSPVVAATDRLRIVSVEHAAATRIQSVFRSYLAKKALVALKGLVKLQAVARGHLVRKHMSATIRKMHAVMSIQVRARFHRIQSTAAISPLQVTKEKMKDKKKKKDKKLNNDSETREVLSATRPYEESSYSYSSTNTSPRIGHYNNAPTKIIQRRASFTNHQPNYPKQPVSPPRPRQESSPEPNYMSKTESSRAKTRSHSEPKQRPPRRSISSNSNTNTRHSASSDGTTNSAQDESRSLQFPSSTSQSDRVSVQGSQEQWFVKLYRPPTSSSPDYYPIGSDREILVAYEPHLNLY